MAQHFAALLIGVCALPAFAQLLQTPALRIDTGMHSAPIRALDVDKAGRFAVTASEDKTARIWDLGQGRLLQTLRPPMGVDNDGKLFAANITPQGDVVAVGGWSPDNDVYLFDRASGAMIQRITGLANTITSLSFSPNGQMLAIGLWGKNGVRLFGTTTTASWRTSQELASDLRYDGEVYGAQFSSDGKRFATASVDGLVRLYDVSQNRLSVLQSARVPGGSQPFGISFSPDATVLAVSFSDSAAVVVLNANTLKVAYLPSIDGVNNGSLNALAWSHNGRELLAAGTWKRPDGQHGLKRWSDAGRGSATETSLAGNSVVALRTLADARVVYAATDPAWGWLNPAQANGVLGTNHIVQSGLIDFRGGRAAFRLAPNASAIGFAAKQISGTENALGFDFKDAAWVAPQNTWPAAQLTGSSLQIADWQDGAAPKLNGRTLALTDNEIASSAAIAPGAKGFALGTSFYVRYYKSDGTLIWRVAAPAATWQVNLSADGRWLVAAFSDGSIRWFRTKDGVEAMAFLPHVDQKRWVAWTPQGYYAASPGGEDLFGWQLNRGASVAADFFPGSRFRATYFRPDVIAAVLAHSDFESALRIANQNLAALEITPSPAPSPLPASSGTVAAIELKTPPVLTVLSPKDGASFSTRDVVLSVAIRAPAGSPPLSLRARLNGSLFELPLASANQWASNRNLVVERVEVASASADTAGTAQIRYEQRVTLPAQDVELMLFADNRNGYSTPAVIRLKWTGAANTDLPVAVSPAAAATQAGLATAGLPPAVAAAPDFRPALYMLAVGVSKYQNASIQLGFASKDATDFVNVFKLQDKQLYRKVEVKLLTDTNAKRDDILDGLEWIRREMTSRDVGVVFMAGHGVNDSDGVYYYLPQDTDPDKLKRTGVIFTEIRNTLAALPGKALFFVDTCHSGNVLGTGRRAVNNDLTAVVNELSSAENGVIVFAASTGRQASQESAEWGNGAFTKAVIEGMSGKADAARTGRVTHKMLDLYVSERVKGLTRGTQSPVTIVPQGISDFPVAITR